MISERSKSRFFIASFYPKMCFEETAHWDSRNSHILRNTYVSTFRIASLILLLDFESGRLSFLQNFDGKQTRTYALTKTSIINHPQIIGQRASNSPFTFDLLQL